MPAGACRPGRLKRTGPRAENGLIQPHRRAGTARQTVTKHIVHTHWQPDAGWSTALPQAMDSPHTLVLAFGPRALMDAPQAASGSAPRQALQALAAAFPHSVLMDCSSAGEITAAHVGDGGLSVVVARFERTPLRRLSTARTGPDQVILLGQAIGVHGPLRAAPDELARLRHLMAVHEPFHDLTFEVTAADGGALHMSISGEPVFDGTAFKGWRGVGSDVTAAVEADRKSQELARRRLQAQLDFTARLLAVNPTPLFVKDTQGRFVMVNPAWLALMGLTEAQVIGTTSADLFGGEAPRHSACDDGLLHSEDSVRYENRLERSGRPPRDTVVTKVRFTQDDGRPVGIIGSIIDVTEFREAERAIRHARDTAEDANRSKSEFIANISHALRTPLQSIVGYSELGAARAKAHPRWQEMFKDIHAGGQRMLTLVNELLDLSKAGNLAATLVLRRHDLAALADEVARALWPLANQRGVAITLRPVALPLWVLADGLRMQQVIRNVLVNALRFAPPASQIEITGRAARAAAPAGARAGARRATLAGHGATVPSRPGPTTGPTARHRHPPPPPAARSLALGGLAIPGPGGGGAAGRRPVVA